MSFLHPQHSYISKDRTLKNVKDLGRLKSISPEKCGRELCLSHVPYNLFNKLKAVISHSQIEKICLIACFNDPFQTLQILESMQRNDCLFSVHLNLVDNVHNNQCIVAIIDLITRGVVISIEVPKELNEENSERLLYGILNSQRELKIVHLKGCALNTTALNHLHELLAKGRISKELNLAHCQGVCKSKLTTKDKADIQKALDLGKKKTRKNLKVKWFDTVNHIGDVDVYREHMKVSVRDVVRTIYNRATKRREERVIQLVRIGLDAWQQYKPGSKRSNQSDNADIEEKRSGMNDDLVESISKQLNSQKISDKKNSSNWRRYLPDAWRNKKRASDFSNPLMKDSDKVKEDNRYLQQPYNEKQRHCTRQRNNDMTRHSVQTFEKPSQQIYSEVHTAPEDSLMDECFAEHSTPQDLKASPPGIQYGAQQERELQPSTREGPRASSDFGSRYQFPYADEQSDHQAQANFVRPTSRSASMSQFVDLNRGEIQPRNRRSLSFSVEPQRDERLANSRQGASSRGRDGQRGQVSCNNAISQRSAVGASFQNHPQGRGNNNNNIRRPVTRGYSREIASRGRGGQHSGNNSMQRQFAGAPAPHERPQEGSEHNQNNMAPPQAGGLPQQIFEEAMRRGIEGANFFFLNSFNDNKTVNATNVAMDNAGFNMRDQNRPNFINNGNLPQQTPAEDQMEHDAEDQGEPQIHGQPGENIRHPEDDDTSDEDNFQDARENL